MNFINYEGINLKPSKVICIGRNYVEHIKELENSVPEQPVVFIKPNSAISDEIHLADDDIHYEGEICFLVQHKQFLAVGFGLDLTKRDIQTKLKDKGLPWERAKAFDGAAVFSEFKTIEGKINELRLELHINDTVVQQGGCELMLFKPKTILKDISEFLTIEDNDVIMTGTPAGVGKINRGDKFTGYIYSNNKLLLKHSWLVE